MTQQPLDEVIYLPCETCGDPMIVNKVYEPYLNGKVRCRDVNCPRKMTEISEA